MNRLERGIVNNEEEGTLSSFISGKGRKRFLTKLAWVLGGLAAAAYVGVWAGGKLSVASAA